MSIVLGRPLLKLGISALVLTGTVLLQSRCHPAPAPQAEQQQSQSQQSQQQQSPPPPASANSQAPAPQAAGPDRPPAKKRKVWTNDDVVSLRTPADTYQLEKEEKEAAEATAAAKETAIRAAAKSDKNSGVEVKLPDTVEETQKMIKDTQDDIQEGTIVLDKMRKELLDAPEEQQPDKQKQIDRLTESLETLRRNLKALEDHLKVLSIKPETENPPAPASSSQGALSDR